MHYGRVNFPLKYVKFCKPAAQVTGTFHDEIIFEAAGNAAIEVEVPVAGRLADQ